VIQESARFVEDLPEIESHGLEARKKSFVFLRGESGEKVILSRMVDFEGH
jgi:hypothetical protein